MKFYFNKLRKKYFNLRKRRKKSFFVKKNHFIRRIFIGNKILFAKKKLPSEQLKRQLKSRARRQQIRQKQRKDWFDSEVNKQGGIENYLQSINLKKEKEKIKNETTELFGTDPFKQVSLYVTLPLVLKFLKTYDRKIDFLKHRRAKIVSKKSYKRLFYFNKKFALLLNYFYFFNKIYSIKNKFVDHVSLLTGFFAKIKLCIFIRSYFSFDINADLIGDFLVLWFAKKKFSVKEIVGTLLTYLNRGYASKGIGGYAILMRGRFTRKDRAMYSWKKLGPMPLSHRISTIDYCNRWVPLKYSQCAFKIYILRHDFKYVRKKHRNVRRKLEFKDAYIKLKNGDLLELENVYEEYDEQEDR